MSSYGGIEETQQSCFCNLFQSPERGDGKGVLFKAPKTNTSRLASRGATGEYTDTDLARDLNALTMEERQAIEEDIHGVIGVIPETEEFVEEKIKDMNMHLENIHPREKQAWDRAVFLRPSLEHDKALRMMSLRARRFQPRQAARAMIQLFEERSKFCGEDLSYQRLTWNDVSSADYSLCCRIRQCDYYLTLLSIVPVDNERARVYSKWGIPNNSRPRNDGTRDCICPRVPVGCPK